MISFALLLSSSFSTFLLCAINLFTIMSHENKRSSSIEFQYCHFFFSIVILSLTILILIFNLKFSHPERFTLFMVICGEIKGRNMTEIKYKFESPT